MPPVMPIRRGVGHCFLSYLTSNPCHLATCNITEISYETALICSFFLLLPVMTCRTSRPLSACTTILDAYHQVGWTSRRNEWTTHSGSHGRRLLPSALLLHPLLTGISLPDCHAARRDSSLAFLNSESTQNPRTPAFPIAQPRLPCAFLFLRRIGFGSRCDRRRKG